MVEGFGDGVQALLDPNLSHPPIVVDYVERARRGSTPRSTQRMELGVQTGDLPLESGNGGAGLVRGVNDGFAIDAVSGHGGPFSKATR